MRAVIGHLFFTGAVLLFGGALIASRVTHAPTWMTESAVSQTVVLAAIFCAAVGLVVVGEFAVKYGFGSLSLAETVLVGVSVLLLAGSWYGISKTLERLPQPAEYTATYTLGADGPTKADSLDALSSVSEVVPFSVQSSTVANDASGTPPSKRPRKRRAA